MNSLGHAMNDELAAVRAKLLDFELNGITKQQKDVLANAISEIMKDAVAKRDASSVIKIQGLQTRLNAITPRELATKQNQFHRKSNSKALPIAIFVIGIALAIVTDIASSILPLTITPYLWLSWPFLALLTIISVFLIWRQ